MRWNAFNADRIRLVQHFNQPAFFRFSRNDEFSDPREDIFPGFEI